MSLTWIYMIDKAHVTIPCRNDEVFTRLDQKYPSETEAVFENGSDLIHRAPMRGGESFHAPNFLWPWKDSWRPSSKIPISMQ